MLKEDKKMLKYNHGEKSLKVPFAIYADLECLLEKNNLEKSSTEKKHSCQNDPKKSCTEKMILKNLLQKKNTHVKMILKNLVQKKMILKHLQQKKKLSI